MKRTSQLILGAFTVVLSAWFLVGCSSGDSADATPSFDANKPSKFNVSGSKGGVGGGASGQKNTAKATTE